MRPTWMVRRIVRYWLGCLLSPMDAILIDSASEQFQLGIFVCSIVAELLGFLAMKIIRERLRLLNGLNSGSRPGPSTVSTLLLDRNSFCFRLQ